MNWLLFFLALLSLILLIIVIILSSRATLRNMQVSKAQAFAKAESERCDYAIKTTIDRCENDKRIMAENCEEEKRSMAENCESEINRMRERFNNEVDRLKNEYTENILRLKAEIDTKRELLNQKTEKDLLIDTMLALNEYAKRIDSLESQISEHANDTTITNRLDTLYDCLNSSITGINNRLSDTAGNSYSGISAQINNIESIAEDIRSSVCVGYGYGIQGAIDEIQSDIRSIESTLDDINNRI